MSGRKFSGKSLKPFLGLLVLMVTMFLLPGDLGAQDSASPAPVLQQGYRFSDHLSGAEASILIAGKDSKTGVWEDDAITFPGLSRVFSISKTNYTINAEMKSVIALRPVASAKRRIRFPSVPPGSELILNFGIDDKTVSETEGTSIYLTVWAGKHKLRRFSIPVERGWKTEKIDLGIAVFLTKTFPVTLEVTIDDRSKRSFGFDAELIR